MSHDPEEIRQEIEATRASLSDDVNALAESVKPGNVARRQAGRVRGAAEGIKDRVMGAASDAGSSGVSAAGAAASAVGDTTSSVGELASAAPGEMKARTRGNPLAAGVIAFGAGWLLSSLAPASRPEQRAAGKVKESAAPVTDAVSQTAGEVADNLKQPARQAVESVQEATADAASHVKAEGEAAKARVT